MAVADLPFDVYDFGRYIGKAITETDGRNGRTVIIASGDLCLTARPGMPLWL